ncbi:MAG: hypothetical protein ACTSPY_02515 [Candidatus Helarchaeota archaeon]
MFIIGIHSYIRKNISKISIRNLNIRELKINNKYFFLLDNKNKPLYDVLFINDGSNITAISLLKINNLPIYLYGDFNEFIRGIYGKRDVSVFWFQSHKSIDFNEFINLDCIKDRPKKRLQLYLDENKRLQLIKIGGIWKTNIIFGTKIIIETNADKNQLLKAYKELDISRIKLLANFQAVYSGISYEILEKNDIINLIQSHLLNESKNSFYLTGLESVNHFLSIPKMVIKSLSSKYPAEFVAPTDIEYDIGPIGKSLETEFQEIERQVGLLSKNLNYGILTSGDSPIERFNINTKILFETVLQEYSFIVITSNKNYRKLIQYITDISIIPFNKFGFDIFNEDGYNKNKYISELEKIFKIALSLNEELPLNALLTEICSSDNPTITAVSTFIETKLRNELSDMSFKDRRAINLFKNLIDLLAKNEAANFFTLKNIQLNSLFHNSVFEIDIRNREIRRLIILLIVLKITIKAYTDPSFGNSLILFIDDADFIFQSSSFRRANLTEPEHLLIEFIKFVKKSGIIPFLSISNPKDIIPDILMEMGNVIVSKTRMFENRIGIRQVLNMESKMGQVSEEHIPIFYSERRKYGYQFEYLSDLDTNEFLFKRPDIKSCFPIIINPLLFNTLDISDEFIKNRLVSQMPHINLIPNIPKYKTTLEKDFRGNKVDIENVLKILILLMDYPSMLLSGLRSGAGVNSIDYYIDRLIKLGYIQYEQTLGKTHKRNEFKITQKGIEIYREYNNTIKRNNNEEFNEEMNY